MAKKLNSIPILFWRYQYLVDLSIRCRKRIFPPTEIKGIVILEDDFLFYGTTKEWFDKRMLAVKSQQREKKITINEKNQNSKPVAMEAIATDPKCVEKIKKDNSTN